MSFVYLFTTQVLRIPILEFFKEKKSNVLFDFVYIGCRWWSVVLILDRISLVVKQLHMS